MAVNVNSRYVLTSQSASQSDRNYAHVKTVKLKKNLNGGPNSVMVVFVPKSCLFDFFFYREIDTVQRKNPIIVTEKYV